MAFTLKKAVSAVVGAISGTAAATPAPAPQEAPQAPVKPAAPVGKKINFKPGPAPVAPAAGTPERVPHPGEVLPGKNWPFPKDVPFGAAQTKAGAGAALPGELGKKIVVVKGGLKITPGGSPTTAPVQSATLTAAGLEPPKHLDAQEYPVLQTGADCWVRNNMFPWVVKHYMPGDKVKVVHVYPMHYGTHMDEPFKYRGYTVEVMEPRERRGNKAFVFRHELVMSEPAGTYTATKVQKLDTQPTPKAPT